MGLNAVRMALEPPIPRPEHGRLRIA